MLQGANANLRVYEASGHLPFIEQREEFAGEYLSFLDAADGVTTSRELILDLSIEAIKAPVMRRPSTPTRKKTKIIDVRRFL